MCIYTRHVSLNIPQFAHTFLLEAAPEHLGRDPAWCRTKWVWRSKGRTSYKGDDRAEKRTCVGVLKCLSCGQLVRSKTQKDAWLGQTKGPCPNRHCLCSNLTLVSCTAFTVSAQFLRNDKRILHWAHFGKHDHLRPPDGILSKDEHDAVVAEVQRWPEANAHQLCTGSSLPGSHPLPEIHPTLANPRRAQYVVGQVKEELRIRTTSSRKGGTSSSST